MNRLVKLVVGTAVSVLLLWLSFRNVDFQKVLDAFTPNLLWYLIPYYLTLVVIHFSRTFRWGILLEPLGKPSFTKLNMASAVGIMGLMLFPFRLGEFVRPILIAEDGKIRPSAAMGSIVVERVVDGLAMAVVLFVALMFSTPATKDESLIQWARWGGVGVFAAFLVILVFIVVAYRKRELAVSLLRKCLGLVSAKLADKFADMLDAFIGGLRILPDGRKIAAFIGYTALYWVTNSLGMMMLAYGFDLPLSVPAAFAVNGILVIGVMIPAGPGMMGTFQGATILGMQLFFPEADQQGAVVAYSWIVWAAQVSQQVVFGMYYVLKGDVSLGSLWRSPSPPKSEAPSAAEAMPGKADLPLEQPTSSGIGAGDASGADAGRDGGAA